MKIKVTPLTRAALTEEIQPQALVNWLAGFGVAGAVGYDTSADLILQAIPNDSPAAASHARQRLTAALADTLRWLADEYNAYPPNGFTEVVIWEACVLATQLSPSHQLAGALVEFYKKAVSRIPSFPESVRRELTGALRMNQPSDLHLVKNAIERDFWQGLWLDFLVGKSTFLECFRDDAVWSLLVATFGEKDVQPLKSVVADIREASDSDFRECSAQTKIIYLNAARTVSRRRLFQLEKHITVAECSQT